MTSDIMQDKYLEKTSQEIRSANVSQIISDNALGFFKRDQNIATKRNNTTELLKVAYKMLSQAERSIEEKNQRIKTLEKITTIDELTGITNRRGFYEAFKREIDLTKRGNNIGGLLIMIDLDRFKYINDNFGHQAGDEALKIVASFLGKAIRKMDIAARIGGDEFILLLPNTNISKSMKRARKLERELNTLSFQWKNKAINIKGSLGLKEYKRGDTIESIIEGADNNMYENKSMNK